MKKKIFVIFVFMLLIATAIISAGGIIIKNNISDSKENQDESVNLKINRMTDVLKKYNFMNTTTDTIIEDEPVDPQTKVTKIGYVSIPATAFVPYDNDVYWITNGNIIHGDGTVYAPVYLPHEAEVTMIEFYWKDEDPSADIGAILFRSSLDSNKVELAEAWSSGSSGNGKSSDNIIDYPKIENNIYTYYMSSYVKDSIGIYGVIIRYNYQVTVNRADTAQLNEPQMNPR